MEELLWEIVGLEAIIRESADELNGARRHHEDEVEDLLSEMVELEAIIRESADELKGEPGGGGP